MFSTTSPLDEVAAMMIEASQGEGSYVVPAPGFFAGLRELCDYHGILLICDELQSSAGCIGKMWGFEHEGVVPDIAASAKGFGGSMPSSAMIAREELASR